MYDVNISLNDRETTKMTKMEILELKSKLQK